MCPDGENGARVVQIIYLSHRGSRGAELFRLGHRDTLNPVVSVISLIVAAAGVAFGVYQWSRQRGHIRV